MALTDTGSARFSFVRGTGQPSGAGNLDFLNIPFTSESFSEKLTSAQSNSMRDDRQMANTKLIRGESSGDVGFEIAYGEYFDELLSGVMQAAPFPAVPAPGDNDVMENGLIKTFFFFEKRLEAESGNQYPRFEDCQINTMSLEMQANSLVAGSISVVGLASSNGTAELAASSYEQFNIDDQLDTNNASLTFTDANDVAIPCTIQSATLTIDNQMRGQQAVGYFYNAGNASGRMKVTLTASVYFRSMAFYDQLKANTGVKATFVYKDTGTLPAANSYSFVMNNLKVSTHDVSAGGPDQDLIVQMEFMGIPESGGNQKTLTITRHTSTV